jgi:hypothetical protein
MVIWDKWVSRASRLPFVELRMGGLNNIARIVDVSEIRKWEQISTR